MRQAIIKLLCTILAKLQKPSVAGEHPINSVVLLQAAALAERPSPIKRVAEPSKPIIFGRRSYAEDQAWWEFEHNKKAREIVDRQREGFF